MSMSAEYGNVLTTRRKELKLSQAEVADLANISEKTLRQLEHGSGSAHLSSLLSVAGVLGLEITLTNRRTE